MVSINEKYLFVNSTLFFNETEFEINSANKSELILFITIFPYLYITKILIMNIEQHKTKIIKKVQSIQDEKLLDEIDTVLNGNYIVAYTIDGVALTKNQYINHIESISEAIANGSTTFSSEEVRNRIFSSKK